MAEGKGGGVDGGSVKHVKKLKQTSNDPNN